MKKIRYRYQWLIVYGIAILLFVSLYSMKTSRDAGNREEPRGRKVFSGKNMDIPLLRAVKQEENLSQADHLTSLPSSLKGLDVPGPIRVDEQEQLELTVDLLYLFQFFLTAEGEEGLDEIEARVRSYLLDQLTKEAFEQAWCHWESFLNYRTRARELLLELSQDHRSMADRLQAIVELREDHFSPEVLETFFRVDQIYDRFMVSRLKILSDDQLNVEQAQKAVRELEQGLPKEIRDQWNDLVGHMDVGRMLTRISSKEDPHDDWDKIRVQYGEGAVSRLKRLQRKRQQWKQRIRELKEESVGMTSDERLKLIQENFTSQEAKRVHVIMKMNPVL